MCFRKESFVTSTFEYIRSSIVITTSNIDGIKMTLHLRVMYRSEKYTTKQKLFFMARLYSLCIYSRITEILQRKGKIFYTCIVVLFFSIVLTDNFK